MNDFFLVLGRVVDLSKISNPKLRKITRERIREFMFTHSDIHSEYGDYTDGNIGHQEYNEEKSGGYADHSDFTGGRSYDADGVSQYTAHSEYGDYSDAYSDYSDG